MSDFHDWNDIRAELHDGDDDALAEERARTEAWVDASDLESRRTGSGRSDVGRRIDSVSARR
ncbi:hypothetical protein [Micromonospora sp. SH-82]|uniref:hypothetical protein n=1 Tax=Micromonospora sp. SH-82 TaxID=3132938 RepID=UPI003EBE694D